jgi:hypothetical protein
MPKESQENCLKTCYKKGHMPIQHRPIGSERFTKDRYVEIKVKEPRTWMLKQRYIYEQNYGKIPIGHKITFADQNKTNFNIDNLVLINCAENMIMNKNGLYSNNNQLTKTGLLIAKVINKTNNMEA